MSKAGVAELQSINTYRAGLWYIRTSISA